MNIEEIENSVKLLNNQTMYRIDDARLIELIHSFVYQDKKFYEFSKQSNHIVLILSELYSCYKSCYDTIAYSRNKNVYSQDATYIDSGLSYITTKKIIDSLVNEGFVENSNGYYDNKHLNKNKTARMRATIKLINLIESIVNQDVNYIRTLSQSDNSYILLNGFNKNKEKYVPNDMTGKQEIQRNCLADEWNTTLTAYNFLLSNIYISSDETHKKYMNPDKTVVKRTFSRYSLSLGGRFHSAWWMRCKSKYRKHITINNEKTVEIDYKAMHPIIAYSIQGIDYYNEIGHDPYYIDNIIDCQNHRELIKLIVLNMLSCRSRTQLERLVRSKINSNKINGHKDYDLNVLIDVCICYHHRISSMFFKDLSTLFQYNESTIAYDIIKHFTNKGIPVLSVHDSFICQEKYKDELNEYMIKRIHELYGVSIVTKIV